VACDTELAVARSIADALTRRVSETIVRYHMLSPGERVLVALSAGPDSVALLAVLADLADRCRVELRAAHFNHRLRGTESDRDQQRAEALSAQLGIPLMTEIAAVPTRGANLEARVRVERYAFLERAAHVQACGRIATGHTLSDQAETVLMRLLRGAGSSGLAGIPPVRNDRLIRPLIECSRSDVMAFLEARGLQFCEDSSNGDRRFLRNRIRHEVLPALKAINPRVERQLASAATILAHESEFLDALARSALLRAGRGELRVSELLSLPGPLQVRGVRSWLAERRGHLTRIGETHLRGLIALARSERPNGSTALPGGGTVIREYDRLRFVIGASRAPVASQRSLAPGGVVTLESGWQIAADLVPFRDSMRMPTDLTVLLADAACLATPLTVRTARPGDRIRPLGMSGRRKLQDVFTDRKVARAARRSCPVVEADGEILWLPGVVRSTHALVTSATRLLLRLRARKTGIAGV
jgi:tRNA(Ile)-lysidine synthase